MIDIQPQHITFGKLLHERLFRIPQYQRAYSWQKKHREDLFSDILDTWKAGNDRSHFMATLVGLRRGKRTIITDEHQVIEIVDGQQRITTLIILLKAIAKTLDRSQPDEGKTGRELDETLVKPDKASLLLLQTNHDSSDFFANYIRTGDHPSSNSAITYADRELLTAMEECEKFVAEWRKEKGSLLELLILLKNRLTFVFHEIGDESVVYTVFEVLNSRGLDVSWFDRLKSELMAIVFESSTGNRDEIINEIHQLWTDIYACVGLRLGMSTQSLQFAATLRHPHYAPNRPLSEEDSAALLARQSKDGPAKVIEVTRWLKSVTETVDRLVADRRKNAVTRIKQARLVATAILLRQDLTEIEKVGLLRRWENVTFRIYGLFNKDARTAVGDYIRLAWNIVNKSPSYDDILKTLSSIGSAYPIEKAVDNLRKKDCYTGWQDELRYFFNRYEEHLAKESGQTFNNEQWNRIWEASAADSIEHIRPQSWWYSMGVEPYPENVHPLGNLLILPPRLNSKLGAKSPAEKADDYRKTGLLVAQEVVESLPEWSSDFIEGREERLLDWAKREWAD